MKTLTLIAMLTATPFMAAMADDTITMTKNMAEDLSVPVMAVTTAEDMVTTAIGVVVSGTEVSGTTVTSTTTVLNLTEETTTTSDMATEMATEAAHDHTEAHEGHALGSMKKAMDAAEDHGHSLKKAAE